MYFIRVDVAIQRRTKPMDKGDRSQPGIIRRVRAARLKRLLNAVQKNTQCPIEQISITGKEIPQPFGKRQYPLMHRNLWENFIDQVCCRLHHAPCVARGTDAAPLTRERDEEIVTTVGAACPGKSMGQDAALQILAKILLDVCGNREAILICVPALGQPGFEMTLHDLINRAAFGSAAPINRCTRFGYRLSLSARSCSCSWISAKRGVSL